MNQATEPAEQEALGVRWQAYSVGQIWTEGESRYLGSMTSDILAESIVNLHNAALRGEIR